MTGAIERKPPCASGVFMASKNVGRLHPDRRVFVARDVEDEEAVGFCFMGGERRIAPANLLSDRLAQVADDHEMARLVKKELASLGNSSTELSKA